MLKVPDIAKLWNIGSVAVSSGATVREVEEAAEELGIVGVLALNGVPFIDAISADRIQRFIELKRKGVESPAQQPSVQPPTHYQN